MNVSSNMMLLLSIASVASSFVAFVTSVYRTRKSIAAKRRVASIARSNSKVKRELVKAYKDRHLDDSEIRSILRELNKAMVEEGTRSHARSVHDARIFVRELHPVKSRRLLEDLARDVVQQKASA